MANPKVCLTFVHVIAQKGYKIKGQAINILAPSYTYYSETSVADQVIDAITTYAKTLEKEPQCLWPDDRR